MPHSLIKAHYFVVADLINESDLLPNVLPLDLTVRKLKQISKFRQLLHMQIKLPWPFDNRDVVQFSICLVCSFSRPVCLSFFLPRPVRLSLYLSLPSLLSSLSVYSLFFSFSTKCTFTAAEQTVFWSQHQP